MRQLKITSSITNRESPSLEKYFQDIWKIPLLSIEEEVDLAQRIKQWDEQALEKMRKANLRFVVSIAKQYQNQWLSLSDLISEGNIWLKKAAQRFDETRWFKFITYAVWAVRQYILKALQEKSKIINPGTSQSTNERKVRQTKYKLQQNLERDPDNFEIATELGRDVSEVEKVQEHTLSTVSLDAPVGSEVGSASLADLLSTSLPSPDSEIIADGISQEVYDLLDLIEWRQRKIIVHYFWLEGNRALGRDDLAEKFGISISTAKTDFSIAIRKIRLGINKWVWG